jgi:hypothetical protein
MKNQELKEALVGFMALAVILAEEFKDGVQASDIADIIVKIQGNEELKAKLVAAYNGIDKVPSEIGVVGLPEGIDLLIAVIPEFTKLIAAIKK